MRDPQARTNLATIRQDIPIVDTQFDRALIAGLADQNDMVEAQRLYALAARQTPATEGQNALGWRADYPPFDWELTDESDFRAQPSRDGERLELFVRSGQGGVIARRFLVPPAGAFAIITDFDGGAARSGAVRLQLRCQRADEAAFLQQELAPGANSLRVDVLPQECAAPILEIHARARRGEPTMRAELSALEIDEL